MEAEKEKKGCGEDMSIANVNLYTIAMANIQRAESTFFSAMDKKARSSYFFHGDKKSTLEWFGHKGREVTKVVEGKKEQGKEDQRSQEEMLPEGWYRRYAVSSCCNLLWGTTFDIITWSWRHDLVDEFVYQFQSFYRYRAKNEEQNKMTRWPPRVTLGRLLPHARGLGFKPRRGGFPLVAKKEWGLSPKAKIRVLHTAQLDVTEKKRKGKERKEN
uniref:Uncharacterized protein n=1 Tax=Tanacetum cinerariifolium TaxID=118510 RepID=A0A6L2MJR1_TANCI|nr:hypothetical protein [Tanacetum cinerariifolium]